MPQPVFLLMPEWQGSPSSRAMQLTEGAAILREDLPRSATREVTVPLEAGDAMGTPIARLSSLIHARDAARRTLAEIDEDPSVSDPAPVIVGGDCASSLAGLEWAARAYGEGLAVLWFDAHPDLHDPSTSPSGSASGMTLRHALGEGSPDLASQHALQSSQLTLVGTRECDLEENDEIRRRNITLFGGHEPDLPAAVSAHLRATGARAVYVHIDLDVIDPAEFTAVHTAVPFGLTIAQLTGTIRAAVAEVPLAGGAICEFAPANPDLAAEDLPTVLRLLGALTSGNRAS